MNPNPGSGLGQHQKPSSSFSSSLGLLPHRIPTSGGFIYWRSTPSLQKLFLGKLGRTNHPQSRFLVTDRVPQQHWRRWTKAGAGTVLTRAPATSVQLGVDNDFFPGKEVFVE